MVAQKITLPIAHKALSAEISKTDKEVVEEEKLVSPLTPTLFGSKGSELGRFFTMPP